MPTAQRIVRDLKLYPSADTSAEWGTVSAAVRNNSFFSACIEDERLLAGLQKLVDTASDKGWGAAQFIDEALIFLDDVKLQPGALADETSEDNFNRLYNVERLRLIYLTQRELSAGYRNFVDAFDPVMLKMYPAWEFYRQEGAKEENKRQDHIDHEGEVRLKTDVEFWLDRNRVEIGGFGNPYGPWGFNSWMTTIDVDRATAESLGLLAPGEKVSPPAELANWNLPLVLQQMGSAGVKDLSKEQRKRVVDRCKEAKIDVKEDENLLQVVPGTSKDSPLNAMQDQVMNAWVDQELKRVEDMTQDEILDELLNLMK